MLRPAAIVLLALLPFASSAQDRISAKDAVLVQISSEMAECAVYYQISAVCVANYPDPQSAALAANMRTASVELLGLALQLGEPAGKTVAGLEAQTKLMSVY